MGSLPPPAGAAAPLNAATRTRLADRLRASPTPADGVCTLRGADARRILKAEFGVARSLSAVYHLLHALGLEPLRPPRPRHPRASAETHPGERVEVWFEDDTRFGQKGTLTTVCREGHRPTALKPGAFGNLRVLAVVYPATGAVEKRISPVLNTGVVQSFLDQLAGTIPAGIVPAGTHVVRVWDGPDTTRSAGPSARRRT